MGTFLIDHTCASKALQGNGRFWAGKVQGVNQLIEHQGLAGRGTERGKPLLVPAHRQELRRTWVAVWGVAGAGDVGWGDGNSRQTAPRWGCLGLAQNLFFLQILVSSVGEILGFVVVYGGLQCLRKMERGFGVAELCPGAGSAPDCAGDALP